MSRQVVPDDFIGPIETKAHLSAPTGHPVCLTPDELLKLCASHEEWRQRAMHLVALVEGGSANCRGCGATIKFVKHANGKTAPYTLDAQNHFASCPAASRFKRSA